MSAEFNAGWNGAVEKLACVLDLKGLLSWRTDSRDSASTEPLSPSPEIRELLHNWHHVRCHSYRPGGACTCWERKEKLIAELARGQEEQG